ncbi:MAG: cobalt-precorrin-5B (C(1))-methyltransferase CbiD [Eubacteriales bacterium]|nr:cobalt-precorrin-5B (C(1))-methyltransferase CbiD [Eubacteriales bacterium]
MQEHKNGLEDMYVMSNHKKLRCGYTTGSCAAAAAKAAARMLLQQKLVEEVELMTPKGIRLCLLTEEASFDREHAVCAIRKNGGDDPDATHGLLIFARVERCEGTQILLDGGEGVGRVTKPGLWQSVGEAAINRVPRQMIREAVDEIRDELEEPQGLRVVISVPGGEEIAKKTFNPRLGIEGGISILGTSGIVVPMSESALIASIRLEMEMLRARGEEYLLITPGNYGESFLKEKLDIDLSNAMKCSNYVGETLEIAEELGVKGILFVSHIGKFIKVSGGIMNTHSHQADCRAELMAAQAMRAGVDADTVKQILDTFTTEEAVDILMKKNMTEAVMRIVTEKIHAYLQHHCGGAFETEAIIFSNKHGYLGETAGAEKLLQRFLRHGGEAEYRISSEE